MTKRKARANAGPAKPAAGNPAADQPQAAGTGAPAPDGGAPTPAAGGDGGGDGAAGPEAPAVTITVLDPDGNPPSGDAPPETPDASNTHMAWFSASALAPGVVEGGPWDGCFPDAATEHLAEFFHAFPDSPDESGLVQLERLQIELPEEARPGLLLAMIRVFRVALDQLDRLDREDAARAEAAKPKPEPEQWREPKGFKQTKKAMEPGSGLKPRR